MTFAKTFKRGDRVQMEGRRGAFIRTARGGHNEAVVEWDGGEMATVDYDALRHAPVRVIGEMPAAAPRLCPQCGNALTLDPDAIKFTPMAGQRTLKKTVLVAACGFCEFIHEVAR